MLPVVSVTELNRQIKTWLEKDVGDVCVQGEISNLSKPSSGHWYFTLKDSQAQIRCVFFRGRQLPTHHALNHGQQVLAVGRLSLYEARGDYQLIVEILTEAGLGDLHQRFEALKQSLLAQGLCDSQRKKQLPAFPCVIGLVTSPTGAAVRDMLSTLARRYPLAAIRIYPSDVQGKAAVGQLVAAIQQANQDACCDVLILARGGGSLEDLWAFNEERVAMAIVASTIPIITGIGHETDVTIADFVADVRAATPTGAAEMVCPSKDALWIRVTEYENRLFHIMRRTLALYNAALAQHLARLTTPQQMIARYWQRLDYAERQLQQALNQLLLEKKHRLHTILAALNSMSPLATLQRGYALVTYEHHVVMRADQAPVNSLIQVKLAQGELTCRVEDWIN